MEKPDVDHIEGLSPAIAIEQKATSHNPRSTVGTITEIYDYLRLLYARVGTPRCPDHHYPLEAQTVSQMVDQVLTRTPSSATCCSPRRARTQGRARPDIRAAARAGLCARARRRALYEIDAVPPLALRVKHTIEAVIDRFKPREDIKQRWPSPSKPRETRRRHGRVHSLDNPEADPCCSRPSTAARLRLLAAGTGAAPVLVQLAGRRLPDLRRPGGGQFFDPDAWSCTRSFPRRGRVRGWDRRNAYYFALIQSLAKPTSSASTRHGNR
jgi:excinuclease ABC subunit A